MAAPIKHWLFGRVDHSYHTPGLGGVSGDIPAFGGSGLQSASCYTGFRRAYRIVDFYECRRIAPQLLCLLSLHRRRIGGKRKYDDADDEGVIHPIYHLRRGAYETID